MLVEKTRHVAAHDGADGGLTEPGIDQRLSQVGQLRGVDGRRDRTVPI